MATFPVLAYRSVLVVVKQTAYQMYRQLKVRGQAPLALRWDRLEHRDTVHRHCVQDLLTLLHANGCVTEVVGREDLHHHHMIDHDLVIAVGGDGTTLSASHFVRGEVPLLGVNSDPEVPHDDDAGRRSAPGELLLPPHEERGNRGGNSNASSSASQKAASLETDTRGSVGALCTATSRTMSTVLPKVLFRDILPRPRARIRLTVSSTYNETTLAPALNDVLVAHPSPAAMGRFRVSTHGMPPSSSEEEAEDGGEEERGGRSASNKQQTLGAVNKDGGKIILNSRSSGLWVCTATGATGAMAAAGGVPMDENTAKELQWRIRDEAAPVGGSNNHQTQTPPIVNTGGMLTPGASLAVRWNSHKGACYVDGHYVVHDLELGDELRFSADAKPLLLF